jgi:hypothetical protein
MEAQRSKNFKKIYKSTGEHSVNIRGHVRLDNVGMLWSLFLDHGGCQSYTTLEQTKPMKSVGAAYSSEKN